MRTGARRLETDAERWLRCERIRVQAGGQWRVLYVAKFAGAVYVLHAFGKKTQRTAKSDIELASRRYNDLLLSLKSAK